MAIWVDDEVHFHYHEDSGYVSIKARIQHEVPTCFFLESGSSKGISGRLDMALVVFGRIRDVFGICSF